MALYGGARAMLLPESATQPRIRPTIVIVHTHVGNPSLDGMRNGLLGSDAEHHFNLRVGGAELAQYVDTEVRADNNFRANSFTRGGTLCGAISIETGDLHNSGDAGLTKSFAQLDEFDALVELIAWCCRTHGIPVQRCASPFEPGVGYHSMWGVNVRGDGPGTFGRYDVPESFGGGTARLNNPWTNALGKTCPGPGKIAEFDRLLAAVRARVDSLGEDADERFARIDGRMRAVRWRGALRATTTSRQARAVQWRLVAEGFAPVGGVDGEYGEKSAAACRRFQAARGLPVTGVVDLTTWRALGLRRIRSRPAA
jgi:hypothetical protein